jgi:hypothetical protein
MDSVLHFLHIYHLDFQLKKNILPSNIEKILWNNKFLKVPSCRNYFVWKWRWHLLFMRPWALNLDYTIFPSYTLANCRPINLNSIEFQNTDKKQGSLRTRDVIKDDFGGKLPSGRPFRPDVREDAGVCPQGCKKFIIKKILKKKIYFIFFGSCCRLGRREIFFNFQFSVFGFQSPKSPKSPNSPSSKGFAGEAARRRRFFRPSSPSSL